MRQAHRRFLVTVIILTALLAWGLVLNINLGSVYIPPDEIFRMVWDAARYRVLNLFTGGSCEEQLEAVIGASTQSKILFSIRMPRMLLAAILGGALAVSGFLLQTFFRNPIAGPFVLGISSGAKLIVGITLVFGAQYLGKISSAAMILSAFAGSLLVVSVVLLFSQKVHSMSMLLVVGIMIGYICSAATDFCIAFAGEHDIANLAGWSMGSFSGANWGNVVFAARVCIPGFLAAWLLSKPIGAYALGEGYAQSLGVNVKLFRAGLILLSSLLSACVTAFAGPVSFVGIAVPHITKTMLKTSRPAVVIPVTYLCGAVFCIYCDLIARTLFSPTELAIGTVTAAFGAPVVIVMMLKRRSAEH
ncbi:MAG: iron ABC transporter permease [Butyrivibrio sp.]|nr:iron ABC transporter permease [Acetatifactor muris]MCM1558844.1 iron ABC transporter permease [Butyrivibrio sp.]